MHEDDHFLFDVTIKGSGYNVEEDINVRAEGDSTIGRDKVKERQWLVAHAVARLWGKSLPDVLHNYESVVQVCAEPDGEIPSATAIVTKVKVESLDSLSTHSTAKGYKSPRTLHEDRVYTMRRFQAAELLDFVEAQGLAVVNRETFADSQFSRHKDLLDMGYILCRRAR